MKLKMKSNITLELFDILNPSIIRNLVIIYLIYKHGKIIGRLTGFKKNCQPCAEVTAEFHNIGKYTFYYTLREVNAIFDVLHQNEYKVRCIHCEHYNTPMYCEPCFGYSEVAYINYEDRKNGNGSEIKLGE